MQNRALRTDATTQQILEVAVQHCGYQFRPQPRPHAPEALAQQHADGGDAMEE